MFSPSLYTFAIFIHFAHGCWIYNYLCNQCLSPLTLWFRIYFRRGVLDTTLCDKVNQWLATGLWFSAGTPVFSTNNTDRYDMAEILLKMVLNTITTTPNPLLHLKHGKLSKVTRGAETTYPPPDDLTSTLVFRVVRSARSLVFCVMFYISLFVPCLFWPL
jgi:hypothetical protein